MLRLLSRLHRVRGDRRRAGEWAARARKAEGAFSARFPLPGMTHLADAWEYGRVDPSVRPNMVIAAALEDAPLDAPLRAAVVARTTEDLLTPVGLRTLSPYAAGYAGTYAGGVEARDRAYHQGTVWPWLLGFYTEASLRAHGRRGTAARELRSSLDAATDRILAAGGGLLPELFDGDPPHRPGGAPHQAWTAGGLLWCYHLLEPRAP
jgi:glycogen debranching enzyme